MSKIFIVKPQDDGKYEVCSEKYDIGVYDIDTKNEADLLCGVMNQSYVAGYEEGSVSMLVDLSNVEPCHTDTESVP